MMSEEARTEEGKTRSKELKVKKQREKVVGWKGGWVEGKYEGKRKREDQMERDERRRARSSVSSSDLRELKTNLSMRMIKF